MYKVVVFVVIGIIILFTGFIAGVISYAWYQSQEEETEQRLQRFVNDVKLTQQTEMMIVAMQLNKETFGCIEKNHSYYRIFDALHKYTRWRVTSIIITDKYVSIRLYLGIYQSFMLIYPNETQPKSLQWYNDIMINKIIEHVYWTGPFGYWVRG